MNSSLSRLVGLWIEKQIGTGISGKPESITGPALKRKANVDLSVKAKEFMVTRLKPYVLFLKENIKNIQRSYPLNMNITNNTPLKGVKVTLADLKRLGKLGNATACLTDGTIVELREHYALKESSAYINKQQGIDTVKVILLYTDIYYNIRTIKHNNDLIARKGKKYLEFVSKKP